MNAPALSARYFLTACLLGCIGGVYYGFLRPLRPKHTVLSDLLFLPVLIYLWLQLSFGVCKGDLRLGYTAGLAVGAVVFDRTAGIWIRPVFWGYWRGLDSIWGWLTQPVKNFFKKPIDFAAFMC